VPRWFFADSLAVPFSSILTTESVGPEGCATITPRTVTQLSRFVPFTAAA
jgi:hypothetical protein